MINLKFYFLTQLPTETEEDLDEITSLLSIISQKYYNPHHLHLSINPFIPKPHTPFQWEPPLSLPYLQKSAKKLQKKFKELKIYDVSFLDPRWAVIQGALSRGDQRLSDVLVRVLEHGGSLGAWRRVMKTSSFSFEALQNFSPSLEKMLPWDFIEIGVDKALLLRRYQKAHH